MIQVGVVTCPGCQERLRFSAGWSNEPVRGKHCGAKFPFPTLQPRPWKGTLLGGCLLGLTALLAALAWPHLSDLLARTAPKQAAGEQATTRAKKKPQQPLVEAEQPAKPAARLKKPTGTLDQAALSRFIDNAVRQKLAEENIASSPRADDAEFLRRVYLDITGVIPPAGKVVAFLNSKDANKRAKVIDELLASPRYGRHLADVWQALLLPRTSDNRRLQTVPLHRWLEESFNGNKPWSQLATELITATGTPEKNGAVTFYIANPTPDKITDTVTRLFLGVQLQCAQCHNHPFTSWKQDEYWAMAAFFSKVRMNGNPRKAAKKGVGTVGLSENGKGKALKRPGSARNVPPRFLQGERPKLNKDAPYRPVLARWLTAPENPFFARAMVNRTWAHFFGRGFVNPVDDMNEDKTPSHALLLDVLAEQFAQGGYNLKDLIRAICNSAAYQRTSRPSGKNGSDSKFFSHMALKVLSPEQLYDSLESAVGGPNKPAVANKVAAARVKKSQLSKQQQQKLAKQQQKKKKKGQPGNARAAFVAFFQTGDDNPTDYQAGIPQALRMMNSAQFNNGRALLVRVLREHGRSPARAIEQFYLATLSRRPTAAETDKLVRYVRKQGGPSRPTYSDVLWALLNSSEFTLNH